VSRRASTGAESSRVDARARAAAGRIRRFVARISGAAPAEDLVLAPGVLAALRLLLADRGVRRLVLSDQEYYAAPHFPGMEVTVAPVADIVRRCRRARADAVVLSTISYRGMRVPFEAIVAELRDSLGARAPLVIADVTQNGAAGFPRIDTLGADVCCGDASKWITPIASPDRLAYLWLGSGELRAAARRLYGGFFQATTDPGADCAARWIQPEHLFELDRFVTDQRITPRRLATRHAADLELARALATVAGAPEPETAILWIPDARLARRRLSARVRREHLAWDFPGEGTRVLCQTANQLRAGTGAP
jgi:hypothetical protein